MSEKSNQFSDFFLKIPLYFRMYGLFQTSFYFGYMAVFSTALGIMCGELPRLNQVIPDLKTLLGK